MKKKTVGMMAAVLVFAAAAGAVFWKSRARPWWDAAICSEYVEVPAYTGRSFRASVPRTVDEAYMDSFMDRMLAVYNEIRGTEDTCWTDGQVAYTTEGKYKTLSSWRDYLQKKYTAVERRYAREDTAQRILSEIAADARLLGYEKEDYQAVRERMTEQSGQAQEEILESLKMKYVIEAIAEEEGLEPDREDLETACQERMEALLEMGYTQTDACYLQELEHWKEEEDQYRLKLTADAVKEFLYENNIIEGKEGL